MSRDLTGERARPGACPPAGFLGLHGAGKVVGRGCERTGLMVMTWLFCVSIVRTVPAGGTNPSQQIASCAETRDQHQRHLHQCSSTGPNAAWPRVAWTTWKLSPARIINKLDSWPCRLEKRRSERIRSGRPGPMSHPIDRGLHDADEGSVVTHDSRLESGLARTAFALSYAGRLVAGRTNGPVRLSRSPGPLCQW